MMEYTVRTDWKEIEHCCCFDAVLMRDGERVAEFWDKEKAFEICEILNGIETKSS